MKRNQLYRLFIWWIPVLNEILLYHSIKISLDWRTPFNMNVSFCCYIWILCYCKIRNFTRSCNYKWKQKLINNEKENFYLYLKRKKILKVHYRFVLSLYQLLYSSPGNLQPSHIQLTNTASKRPAYQYCRWYCENLSIRHYRIFTLHHIALWIFVYSRSFTRVYET